MKYAEFLIDQKERNDYVGIYANKVITNNSLPHFETLEEHLEYELDISPDDLENTVAVILSWLEFCEQLFADMSDHNILNSKCIREIRIIANRCLKYLNIYWDEYFFYMCDIKARVKVIARHKGFSKWVMELEEFETEYRYREASNTICDY